MEPGPETQRAFRAFDDLIISKAPVWVPALLAIVGALWLMRSLPALLQVAVLALLVWLFLDGDHRKRALSIVVDAGRFALNWLHKARMSVAPERQRVMGFAAVPADRFAWLRKVPWLRVFAVAAVFWFVVQVGRPIWGFFSCPFGLCETKEEVVTERDALRGAIAVDEVLDDERRDVAEIGKRVAIERAQISVQSERGRDEIAAAAPEAEEPLNPELVAAWRVALNRLCLYPESSGALPAGC